MNRSTLDRITAGKRLSAEAFGVALALTGNRPDAAAWREFGVRLLSGIAVAGLGAGAIFFIAANWQDYGAFARFAILEIALLACAGVALWRVPPQPVGQGALLLATLLVGALLALFGQSYQTGADLYELFILWSLLALPFTVAAQSGAAWAMWLCIVNVGLALFVGAAFAHGWQRLPWFGARGLGESGAAMMVSLADFALAGGFLLVARSRFHAVAPRWLLRLGATFAFGAGTLACLLVVLAGPWNAHDTGTWLPEPLTVALFAGLSLATAIATLRRRTDVYPLALVAAAWIAISTCYLGHNMHGYLATFFVLTLWLLGLSAGAGMMLMRALRAWDAAAAAASAPSELAS